MRLKVKQDALELGCDLWEEGKFRAAFHMFLQAAKEGNPHAQLNLAHFYSEGIAVRRCRRKSMRWLNIAAKSGYAPAANNIGMTFRNEKKYDLALHWLEIAGNLGDGDALYEMGKIHANQMNDVLNAVKCLRRALESHFITEGSREEAGQLFARLESAESGRLG